MHYMDDEMKCNLWYICIAIFGVVLSYIVWQFYDIFDVSEMADQPEFDWENAKSVHDFTVRDIKGEEVKLDKYKGNVLLVVNVASKCGLTKSNYEQLVKIDDQLRSRGLRILAFPCNQFGKQEPGDADTICEFVKKKNATFDFFEKIEVNGKNANPLYKYLKKEQPGTLGNLIKWNFTKFIVDKEGKPVERHAPTTSPESLIPNIEAYL
ncbi:uncharacterized protein Gtpx isoform X2 [Planococcus citri]|uniref:uncharacterized protein Gtpx isoform X2 n=1 Tax=Planococcus citri TaxID=170843 RepID=UPI0031F7FBED